MSRDDIYNGMHVIIEWVRVTVWTDVVHAIAMDGTGRYSDITNTGVCG